MVGIAEVVPEGRFDEDELYVWGFPVVVTAEPYRWQMGCGGSWVAIAGFQDPSCIRFTADGRRAFVCDRAVDSVYRLELEHVAN